MLNLMSGQTCSIPLSSKIVTQASLVCYEGSMDKGELPAWGKIREGGGSTSNWSQLEELPALEKLQK